MFFAKIISSLEKCFIDEHPNGKSEIKELYVFKNERTSFQLCYRMEGIPSRFRGFAGIEISSDMPLSVRAPEKGLPSVNMRTVEQTVSLMPVIADACDDDYLRKTPGLFPDILLPVRNGYMTPVCEEETRSVWIELDPTNADFEPGNHNISITLTLGETVLFNGSLLLHVTDARLPEQTLIFTQWFHCDCLASYYNVPVFSEKHWAIIKNYVRTAVRNGMNMILTPIFTPPLDTHVGGERLTVQLVDVKVKDGGYEFGFKRLQRWVRMCKSCGIKYYEISHLFTQWGAGHAPKIVADVDGKTEKIFGWETNSRGTEYRAFLSAFIPALLSELKRLGIDKYCRFHISDEPSEEQLPVYREAKHGVAKLLEGYPIMDALSSIEFYKAGVVDHPIPACNHIEPFYEAKVPELWTYYCCGQNTKVPNRFISMPSYRNRIIGFLFYKYDIKGFLQWGYNFYNNAGSFYPVNPYISSTGDYFVQSGDTLSVWPAQDGTALESLRISVWNDALNDMRALQLCEDFYGRELTLGVLEDGLDKPLSFDEYPRDQEYIISTRKKINERIDEALKNGKKKKNRVK